MAAIFIINKINKKDEAQPALACKDLPFASLRFLLAAFALAVLVGVV